MGEQKSLATAEKKPERAVTITCEDVRKYLCPRASDPEISLFLKVCQTEGLNPFAREIYLVKYSDDEPAAIIIAIDAFLKAAETCDHYVGHEAGIVLRQEDGVEFREGTFMLDDEKDRLMGGWAKVYRKDRDKPFYSSVNISEYRRFTRKGEPTRFWREMPATMIRNVALRHALKEAFPSRFSGLYCTAEFEPAPDEEIINQPLKQTSKSMDTVRRDPTTITTLTELLKACYEDFGMQPHQVYAELNVCSAFEIVEPPSQCYTNIAATRQKSG